MVSPPSSTTNATVPVVTSRSTTNATVPVVTSRSTTNATVPVVTSRSTTNATVPVVTSRTTTNATVPVVTSRSTTNATVPVVTSRSTTNATVNAVVTSRSTTVPVFSYKAKIINPTKKSDVILRQLNFTSKFESLTAMRVQCMEQFQEQVPNTMDFKLGYYGAQQAKVSLITSEDLNAMYLQHPTGSITLWCEGRAKEEEKRKRPRARFEKEEDVESTFISLQDKHGEEYDTPRLRLWSRMISSGLQCFQLIEATFVVCGS